MFAPAPSTHHEFGPHSVHELLTGTILYSVPPYYDGYGDPDGQDDNLEHFISDRMLADWHTHRDELVRLWRAGMRSYDFPEQYTSPMLCFSGDPDTPCWAEVHLDGRKQ
jgi:hypothetical protein